MFSHAITDHAHELPRALQQLLAREQAPEADTETVTALPRRSFLKLGAASGFALGVFPLLSHAQGAAPAAPVVRQISKGLLASSRQTVWFGGFSRSCQSHGKKRRGNQVRQ